MTCTYSQAIDEMFALFLAGFTTPANTLLGYTPEIRWVGIDRPNVPDSTKFWVRVSLQTVKTEQTTFAESVGTTNGKRYTSNGMLIVEIFAPKGSVESFALHRDLCDLILSIFRTRTANVWFRNTTVEERKPENGCTRVAVISDFQYDSVS